jgi:epoxyqueuosine reductase
MKEAGFLRDQAGRLGFDLFAIAAPQRAPHAHEFQHWLESGYAGQMAYLGRNVSQRLDPRVLMPECRSMIICGKSYFTAEPESQYWLDPSRGRVARYAWGRDYHESLETALQELEKAIKKQWGSGVNNRLWVDAGPVLEKDFAAAASLGFYGKNSCLIHPRLGSYFFLAEIMLDIPLAVSSAEENAFKNGTCGLCRRCLQACPTAALVRPYVLDSRRCISYLTIENKGAIPLELRPLMKNWLFGCDECQSCCPYVKRFSRPSEGAFLEWHKDTSAPSLPELIALSPDEFKERFKGSPLWRAKRKGLLRNACVALGNWGSPEAIAPLGKALKDNEALIRQHAAWALGQIDKGEAKDKLRSALPLESSTEVTREITMALAAGRT